MKKTKPNYKWMYYSLSVFLVAIIGFSIWWQLPINKLKANNISAYTITAELGEDQPYNVSQKSDQRIAQFNLSTNSPDPVEIDALEFYALGSLKNKIVRKLNLAPLRLRLGEEMLGEGESWNYDYGSIQQLVNFTEPLILVKDQTAIVDVYVDLFYQHDQTFGVSLIGIGSPLVVEGIPLNVYIHKIKTF